MWTLWLCGPIKTFLSSFEYQTSTTQQHWLNKWRDFGAGLSVWLTNGNQGEYSGNLFEHKHWPCPKSHYACSSPPRNSLLILIELNDSFLFVSNGWVTTLVVWLHGFLSLLINSSLVHFTWHVTELRCIWDSLQCIPLCSSARLIVRQIAKPFNLLN